MGRIQLSRPAPEGPNSLAAYECSCGLGELKTSTAKATTPWVPKWDTPSTGSVPLPAPSPTPMVTKSSAGAPSGSVLNSIANVMQSEQFLSLTQTGLNVYQHEQARRIAQQEAERLERQAAAMEALQREQALMQTTPGGSIVGRRPVPSWAIPAAIGGGVLVLALFLMRR